MLLCELKKIRSAHDSVVKEQANAVDNLVIPTQTNDNEYDAEQMSDEQKAIVYRKIIHYQHHYQHGEEIDR